MILDSLASALKGIGLLMRGGFHPSPGDGVTDGVSTVVLVGNAGPAMWAQFSVSMPDDANPLDTWTRAVVDPIADEFGAKTVYPFAGPPYSPFQKWAMRADTVYPSPIGPLIHPKYGMWHAYRAALLFEDKFELPVAPAAASPCDTCADRPCLKTCPVKAFSTDGYDVPACRTYIGMDAGAGCLSNGCLARRACPIGQEYIYEPGQALFHMEKFLHAT